MIKWSRGKVRYTWDPQEEPEMRKVLQTLPGGEDLWELLASLESMWRQPDVLVDCPIPTEVLRRVLRLAELLGWPLVWSDGSCWAIPPCRRAWEWFYREAEYRLCWTVKGSWQTAMRQEYYRLFREAVRELWMQGRGYAYRLYKQAQKAGASQTLEDYVRRRGEVTPRMVARSGPRAYRGQAAKAREALQELVDRGVGVWERRSPGPQGGRPTEVFRVIDAPKDTG